jgi:GDP-4-dehydro-6-deoxy-D-mannose reductase
MTKKRVVISGINGFVGGYLAPELSKRGCSVIGIGVDEKISASIAEFVDEYYRADLTKKWPEIDNVDVVIHLAGLAAVGPSFDAPQKYINLNSAMVTNLGEYYLKQDKQPRIIVVSSSTIYRPDQPIPISEKGDVVCSSPYAVSKLLNENQVDYYRSRGLDCIVVRPFNHIGPGQNTGFILPDLYERLSSISKDKHTIITGNIKTKRDYTDVRDIARAYSELALAEKLNAITYNLCSGKSVSGTYIFETLKDVMGLDDVDYKIDPDLVRPTDVMDIVGDSSLLKSELGWESEIDIRQTITDFVKSKTHN